MIFISIKGQPLVEIPNGAILGVSITTLVLTLAFYLLRSLGLYFLAKNNNVKLKWLAFIPIAWIYTALSLIGQVTFFGKIYKYTALVFTIVFAVAEAVVLTEELLFLLPLVKYYLQGGSIYLGDAIEGSYMYATSIYTLDKVGYSSPAVYTLYDVLSYAEIVFQIAKIFIVITVYIELFKKFWPEHYVLASFLSILGLFAPFVFAIRNRKGIDYKEYVRQRYEQFYRAQGINPQDLNNRGGDPFDNFTNSSGAQGDDPFSSGSGEDKKDDNPFPEFDDKRKQ